MRPWIRCRSERRAVGRSAVRERTASRRRRRAGRGRIADAAILALAGFEQRLVSHDVRRIGRDVDALAAADARSRPFALNGVTLRAALLQTGKARQHLGLERRAGGPAGASRSAAASRARCATRGAATSRSARASGAAGASRSAAAAGRAATPAVVARTAAEHDECDASTDRKANAKLAHDLGPHVTRCRARATSRKTPRSRRPTRAVDCASARPGSRVRPARGASDR